MSRSREIKAMNHVKDEAKRLIEKMPDTATWDDIMYELYVKQKIATGLQAADEGRVISHEEAKKRLLAK
jgi:predicted transcriptional regulator